MTPYHAFMTNEQIRTLVAQLRNDLAPVKELVDRAACYRVPAHQHRIPAQQPGLDAELIDDARNSLANALALLDATWERVS